jgi:hypothetical protein
VAARERPADVARVPGAGALTPAGIVASRVQRGDFLVHGGGLAGTAASVDVKGPLKRPGWLGLPPAPRGC